MITAPFGAAPADLLPLAGRLRGLFQDVGYTVDGVDELLGPLATSALGRGDLLPALAAAQGDSQLDILVRLFLLAGTETAATARFLPPEILESAAAGRVRAALDLRPHGDGWWVAADIGWEHPPPPDHVIGIGAASMTLVAATLRNPVRTALDLGTGCGIQALHLTRHVDRVTATDAVPRAVDMARLTFALSGFTPDAIETLCGDMFAPVSGRQFDLVVSNPPFVLAPPGAGALRYRDALGGDDSALGPLLSDAAAALAPGGVAQVLTSWIIDAGGDWRDRPAELLPSGYDALVLLREVLDPAEHVALWRDDDEPEPAATRRALDWLAHIQRLGAGGIAYGLVVLRRDDIGTDTDSDTDRAPRVRFLDLTAERSIPTGRRLGGWLDRLADVRQLGPAFAEHQLSPAGDLRLVEESEPDDGCWSPSTRHLVSASALPETLSVDQVTAGLVAGCAGGLPIGAVAELLSLASGAPADGVLRVAAELVETGHLTIATGPASNPMPGRK